MYLWSELRYKCHAVLEVGHWQRRPGSNLSISVVVVVSKIFLEFGGINFLREKKSIVRINFEQWFAMSRHLCTQVNSDTYDHFQ